VALAEILLSHKSLAEMRSSLAEYEQGFSETDKLKEGLMRNMRQLEADARKASNEEEEMAT
jgi:hypothetical protein